MAKGKGKRAKKSTKSGKRTKASSSGELGLPYRSTAFGSSNRPALGMPESLTVVLRYCEQVTLDATSTVAQNVVMSANGCYDPNVSGTGHQPYCFDQYCPAIYNRWVVTRSRVKVSATSAPSSTLSSALIAVRAIREENTNALNDISSIVESNDCLAWAVVSTTSGTRPVRTKWLDIASYLGIDRRTYRSSTTFGGTAAANPSLQVYYYVAAGPSVYGTETVGVVCTIEIEYDVTFYSAEVPGASVPVPVLLTGDEQEILKGVIKARSKSPGPIAQRAPIRASIPHS